MTSKVIGFDLDTGDHTLIAEQLGSPRLFIGEYAEESDWPEYPGAVDAGLNLSGDNVSLFQKAGVDVGVEGDETLIRRSEMLNGPSMDEYIRWGNGDIVEPDFPNEMHLDIYWAGSVQEIIISYGANSNSDPYIDFSLWNGTTVQSYFSVDKSLINFGTDTNTDGVATFLDDLEFVTLSAPPVSSRDKVRVWAHGLYTIGMANAMTYGYLNDYAMTFQMNASSDRGWWWGTSGHSDAQGSMSLTTDGRLYLGDVANVGSLYSRSTIYGVGNITTESDLTVEGDGIFESDINLGLSSFMNLGAASRFGPFFGDSTQVGMSFNVDENGDLLTNIGDAGAAIIHFDSSGDEGHIYLTAFDADSASIGQDVYTLPYSYLLISERYADFIGFERLRTDIHEITDTDEIACGLGLMGSFSVDAGTQQFTSSTQTVVTDLALNEISPFLEITSGVIDGFDAGSTGQYLILLSFQFRMSSYTDRDNVVVTFQRRTPPGFWSDVFVAQTYLRLNTWGAVGNCTGFGFVAGTAGDQWRAVVACERNANTIDLESGEILVFKVREFT